MNLGYLTGRVGEEWVESLELQGGIPWLRYTYKSVIAKIIFEPTKSVLYIAPAQPLSLVLDHWEVPV